MGVSCLNRRNYFPPEQPRWCSQPSTTKSARLCCDEHDMCNADLRPQLAFSPDSVLSEGIAGNNRVPFPLFPYKHFSVG